MESEAAQQTSPPEAEKVPELAETAPEVTVPKTATAASVIAEDEATLALVRSWHFAGPSFSLGWQAALICISHKWCANKMISQIKSTCV